MPIRRRRTGSLARSRSRSSERAHPFVVRVAEAAVELPYDFVPLRELRAQMRALRDGHLLVASMRLLHAFGLWGKAGEIASG